MTASLPSQRHHAFARSDKSQLGVWWWTMDRWLLGATCLLVLAGILLSFGNSPAAAARIGYHDPFHFAVRQLIFGIGGAAVMIATSMLTPRLVRRTSFIVYIVSILGLVGLFFIGHHTKGATRWLDIAGFTLQPSEFLKPALLEAETHSVSSLETSPPDGRTEAAYFIPPPLPAPHRRRLTFGGPPL